MGLQEEVLKLAKEFWVGGLTARVGGVKITVAGPLAKENIDERLARLEAARSNLKEALDAVDALQETANANKRDLEILNASILEAQADKANVGKEVESLKAMAALDTQSVRRALGLPTAVDVWWDRLIAFCVGIVASFLATVLWETWLKAWF